MPNTNHEQMDGVFTTSSTESGASPSDTPIRPAKPKLTLGRERKVGLAVIGALLVIFVIVLVIRLRGPGDGDVAQSGSDAGRYANDAAAPETAQIHAKSSPTVVHANSSAPAPRYWGDAATSNESTDQVGPTNRADYGESSAGLSSENPFRQGEQNDPSSQDEPSTKVGRTRTDPADSNASQSVDVTDSEYGQPDIGWPSARHDSASASRSSAQRTKSGDPFGSHRQAASVDPLPGSAYNDSVPGDDKPDSISSALVDGSGSNRVNSASDQPTMANDDPFRPEVSGTSPAVRSKGRSAIADDAADLKIVANPADTARSSEPDWLDLQAPARGQTKTPSPAHANSKLSEAPPFSATQPKNPFADRTQIPEGAASRTLISSNGAVDPASAGARLPSAPELNAPRTNNPPQKLDDSLTDGQPATQLSDRSSASSTAENYTVQANETYWTIAEKTYGSGAYFKAVYEHNRRQPGNAERLQAGMRLSLPNEAALQRLYPQLCPKSRKPAKAGSHATRARPDDWAEGPSYVVAEGDTLYEIARTRLGKSSRWAEIYELNRDVLGDTVQHLEPGTRLVLPQSGVSNRIQ